MTLWETHDDRALLELLAIDTTTPMETGRPSALRAAQELFAQYAEGAGMTVVHHQPPPASALLRDGVPRSVHERVAQMGAAFLDSQPNLVLRLGPPRPPCRTLVVNAHLDTVSGTVPVGLSDGCFTGRGAADAKGPAVGALVGIRAAIVAQPHFAESVTVVMQAVGGEEGGAMGVYGTREVTEGGYRGRLNLVCEPTRLGVLDHGTTSMTARITVDGSDSTDDEPVRGDNATLILGYIAAQLAEQIGPPLDAAGVKLCVAGLRTGEAHNRVFGTGTLLINLAYPSPEAGADAEALVEAGFDEARAGFAQRFAGVAVAERSAARIRDICRLEWLKRGLPVLANRDAQMEAILRRAGVERHDPAAGDPAPFTCDAMWLHAADAYTAVFGPGDLGHNGAHTPHEWMARADLETYAARMRDVVMAFAAQERL